MTRPSLEDEKQALLNRMAASRVAYRRSLLGTDTVTTIENTASANSFPRSKTLRWIKEHPYLCMLAVAAVAAGPRRIVRTARGAIGYASAASSTVARNQNRIRVALGIASGITRLIAMRRNMHPDTLLLSGKEIHGTPFAHADIRKSDS